MGDQGTVPDRLPPDWRDYAYGRLVGRGRFADARLFIHRPTGAGYVVKQITAMGVEEEDEECQRTLALAARTEIHVLSLMKHPHVLQLHGWFVNAGVVNVITTPYAEGGTLENRLRRFASLRELVTPQRAATWASQLTSGLAHIHEQGVLHRDVKTANIFVTASNDLIIGDFGVSKVGILAESTSAVDFEHDGTCIGTPYYLSPEIVLGRPYGPKNDVWALGVVLYEICALQRPFDGINIHVLAQQIVADDPMPLPGVFGEDMQLIVSGMLHKRSAKRPHSTELARRTASLAARAEPVSAAVWRMLSPKHLADKFSTLASLPLLPQTVNEAPPFPRRSHSSGPSTALLEAEAKASASPTTAPASSFQTLTSRSESYHSAADELVDDLGRRWWDASTHLAHEPLVDVPAPRCELTPGESTERGTGAPASPPWSGEDEANSDDAAPPRAWRVPASLADVSSRTRNRLPSDDTEKSDALTGSSTICSPPSFVYRGAVVHAAPRTASEMSELDSPAPAPGGSGPSFFSRASSLLLQHGAFFAARRRRLSEPMSLSVVSPATTASTASTSPGTQASPTVPQLGYKDKDWLAHINFASPCGRLRLELRRKP